MKQTKLKNGFTKIEAEEGKTIHKIGTDEYHGSFTMLPGESLDMYEEVAAAEEPAYTEAEYEAKVSELIHERYSVDKEIALMNNVKVKNPTQKHIDEYEAYQGYRAECKARAVRELSMKDKE